MREYVKQNLARYKVPRDVVSSPELPRNPTGKVLKRELVRSGGGGDGRRRTPGSRADPAAPGSRDSISA